MDYEQLGKDVKEIIDGSRRDDEEEWEKLEAARIDNVETWAEQLLGQIGDAVINHEIDDIG